MTDVVSRTAAAKSFMSKLWRLTKPYWFATNPTEVRLLGLRFTVQERWIACGLLLTIIAMGFFLVMMSKFLNDWSALFYNAIQEKDEASFWRLLLSFDNPKAFFFSWSGLALVYIVFAVYRAWLRQFLTIRWRRWRYVPNAQRRQDYRPHPPERHIDRADRVLQGCRHR